MIMHRRPTSFFFRMKMKQWNLGLDLNSTVCRDRWGGVAFGECACEWSKITFASWRCGDWEFGRSFSKSPKLQVSQQRKQQRAFVCLCRRSHLVILGNKVSNTTDSVLVMGERWGRYGCKDCLYRVKGSWAMGVRPWFAASSRKFGGKLWYNGGKLP